MKRLYSIYYFFYTFLLAGAFIITSGNDVRAYAGPITGLNALGADSSQLPNTILKDNRKNKPKIFQDPVKTYDDRQLLFFTTFGFDEYPAGTVDLQALADQKKIISNFKVYPNPVYVNTQNLKISYDIKENALVTVKMLDVLGNEVSTLYTQRVDAGSKTNEFNIASKVTGGFYFIRLSAGPDHVTKKISVVQ